MEGVEFDPVIVTSSVLDNPWAVEVVTTVGFARLFVEMVLAAIGTIAPLLTKIPVDVTALLIVKAPSLAHSGVRPPGYLNVKRNLHSPNVISAHIKWLL